MLKKYIHSIFQQYNSKSKSGKYYIDQDDNILFASKGKVEKIAEERNVDCFIIGNFDHNICLCGRLDNQVAGEYLLTSDGPKLTKKYNRDD